LQLPDLFTQQAQQSWKGPGYTITRLAPALKHVNSCLTVSYHPADFPFGVHLHQRRPQALQAAKNELQKYITGLQQQLADLSSQITALKTKVQDLEEATSAADEDQPAIELLQRKLENHRLLMQSSIADWNQLVSLRQQLAGKKEAKTRRQQNHAELHSKAALKLQVCI
jgi:chromosome segregation ATPase